MYVYIHIPFCHNICSYCDFAKIYYQEKYVKEYLKSLKKEILTRYSNEIVKAIYIGGGTPTSLNALDLEELLSITNIFNKNKTCEFTVESNIELDIEKIKILKKYKVNRISLGVQSFNDKILKILNRTHKEEDIIKTIKILKENNFDNINIDLIYGVTDDINIVKKDIDKVIGLNISHISCYSLIIEDNTMLKINKFKSIDEEVEYDMYKYIEKKLIENGYNHYEISNYAKSNKESIHNINYWNNGAYYGFGLGAVSYINNYRIFNTRNINKYIEGLYQKEKLYEDKKVQMETDIMLGLRKLEGINLDKFYLKYGKKVDEVFNIEELLNDKYLIIKDNYLKINKEYIYISNEILLQIMN